jgi:spore maturation protein CgeB
MNKYTRFGSVGLGYRNGWMGTPERDENRANGHYWGDEYAQKLNEARISITDGSVLNIAVPKYFEVPACNTVLMAPYPDNYEELHFEDGKNMVDVNLDNIEEKLYYYLENDSECKKIAQNGMDMIMKYHTAEIRVKELYKLMEEYIK